MDGHSSLLLDGSTGDGDGGTNNPSSSSGMPGLTNMSNRKAFLLGLVPTLTLDEIWSLQTRLADLDLRTDIFGRLPLELQIIVADQLGPSDLGSCLAVSRRWQSVLLHDSLRNSLSRRCFPSLLGYMQAGEAKMKAAKTQEGDRQQDRGGNNTALVAVEQIFMQTAIRYALRGCGRFRFAFRHVKEPSVSVVNPGGQMSWVRDPSNPIPVPSHQDRSNDDVNATISNALRLAAASGSGDYQRNTNSAHIHMARDYAYGRIVWETVYEGRTSFLVDDLRTGQRSHFEIANNVVRGDMYVFVAFGDTILVAASGTRLMAWNFITGEHQAKMVPSEVDIVTTLGRRVCVVSQGNIYWWEVGGSVQEVDMTGLDAKHRQPDNDGRLSSYLILDPVQEDVFFLGKYEVESDALRRSGHFYFYVHEFRGRAYRQTYTHRLAFENSEFPMQLIEAMNRRNAYGLYSLASWRVCNQSGYSAHSEWGSMRVEGIGSVAFDIYTKTFSQSFFRLPTSMPQWTSDGPPLSYVHIWNDQMMTVMDRYKEAAGGKVYKGVPLLFAFDDENSEAAARQGSKPFSAVPLYTSQPVDVNGDDIQEEYRDMDYHLSDTAILFDATHMDTLTQKTHRQEDAEKQPRVDPTPERRVRVPFGDVAPYPPGSWALDDGDWARDNCLARYALDLGALSPGTDSRKPAHVGFYYLQGDDDFLTFYYNHECTVWSFRDDPVGKSRERMAGRMEEG